MRYNKDYNVNFDIRYQYIHSSKKGNVTDFLKKETSHSYDIRIKIVRLNCINFILLNKIIPSILTSKTLYPNSTT